MNTLHTICRLAWGLLLAASLLAFSPSAVINTVFDQLGVSPDEASEDIQSSLIGGSLYTRNRDAARAIPPAARAGVIQQIGTFAKEVVSGPAFKIAYQQERESNKPQQSDYMAQDITYLSEEEQAEMKKYYQEAISDWEHYYPADHRHFVKRRLQEFLDATADVDFDAALQKHPYSNKKIFVNPAYEEKPEEWKIAYRAGREATEAARQFARQWLRELPQ